MANRFGLWLRNRFPELDPVLLATLGVLSLVGLATLYSAASDHPGRFGEQLRNYGHDLFPAIRISNRLTLQR